MIKTGIRKVVQQWASERGGSIDRRAVSIDYASTDSTIIVVETLAHDAMGVAAWTDSDRREEDLMEFLYRLSEAEASMYFGTEA